MTPPVRTVLHHVEQRTNTQQLLRTRHQLPEQTPEQRAWHLRVTTAELQSCPDDEKYEWLLEVAAQCVAWAAVVLEGEREPAA